ncbi:MAG: methyl-accepting chemotaxis protein [Zoogloea sp.]|uniref:methyl-accepting chemotaxis protein n=1 Tax=Zoogloea sp. TaxID=49181 RepID=UPI0026155557|nr:methyl-accepting chemotaxis protein [Zoogloea sp.]MDD3328982.1 methyl-accepting chemotaxis protein [Zoogloea sp.]
MNALFAPAVALLNRMRYPKKFALLGVIALLVIGSLLVQLAMTLREDIDFAEKEVDALGITPRLLQVIQTSQQHRGLSSGLLNGNEEMRPLLQKKTGEVAAAIKSVGDGFVGGAVPSGLRRWQEVQKDWAALESGGLQLKPRENLLAHTAMIRKAVLTLHDLGDDGNLTLDPSADTYYLIDNVIRRVPDVSERLGRLRAMGTGALAAKSLDDQRRFDISTQLGELNMTLADFNENLDRAATANPALRGSLDKLGTEFNTVASQVIDALQEHILKGDFEMAPKAYFDLVTRAIDMTYAKTYGELIPWIDALLKERIAAHQKAFLINAIISGVALLLLLYLAVGFCVAVLQSVKELRTGAQEFANCDLRSRINFSARDELRLVADQFNEMAQAVAVVIGKVQSGANDVAGAAVALAGSASRVSDGSEQQSTAATGMAAAIEQMTVGISEIASSAASAEGISSASGRISSEGGAVVARTVAEMKRIASSVRDSAEVIQQLGDQSTQISAIVNSIKEIADQTNLLALNAAIEAARAGETGRGFAVVADEVRKLAERTAKATDEITGMVAAIQKGTRLAVETMNDGVTRVEGGVELAGQAGDSMEQIRAGAGQVVDAVTDISAALREQGAASTEIARNVEHIAQMAEQNSAAVRDTADTAQRLKSLAQQLQDEVAHFKI